MDLYAENILEHAKHPRNAGELQGATVDHEEQNHACGDSLHLWLSLKENNVTDIKWTGTGCAISQASMSILSEELIGKSQEEILAIQKDTVYEMLGVPIGPRRFKCALMSLHCAKNAIHKAKDEPLQSWVQTVQVEE